MDDFETTLIGRGREVLEWIVDPDSFKENEIGGQVCFEADYGPGAVVGSARIGGGLATVIVNDAEAFNDRFPVVFAGVIGLEEAYKMASAVYRTLEADADKTVAEKRPILLIVDTPGNAPGKLEEILGMNKATGAYQLALAEARKSGHPVVALVIGRAISGGFLCHGLQADRILALPAKCGTVIHVMPLTSIARIAKMDIERLETLARDNPVFASGVDYFYALGGLNEVLPEADCMRDAVIRNFAEIRDAKSAGHLEDLGPVGRARLGAKRGGRVCRMDVARKIDEEFAFVAEKYVDA